MVFQGRRSLLLLVFLLIVVVSILRSHHNGELLSSDKAVAAMASFPSLSRWSTFSCSSCRTKNAQARLEGPLEYDDPHLLSLIREQYLHHPSADPYNLTEDDPTDKTYIKYKEAIVFLLAANAIRYYFKDVKNGVFVEAGALDGEYLSNTLRLEKDQGWTGLLVEPDHSMFQHVQNKKRKAWTANCCLATKPFPHKAVLTRAQVQPVTSGEEWMLNKRGGSALLESRSSARRLVGGFPIYERVQCLPLASLLLALNITKVDYISLDVEDVEEPIVDNFPFDRIQVDVWYIEHRHPNTTGNDYVPDISFINKFVSHGFTHHFMGDYVFVRNGSPYSHLPNPPAPHIKVYTPPPLPNWLDQRNKKL